ncbi:hypothetical protein CK203_095085 [Vitis vinifera]|uniref:Uncharacterized protein n=1 Tax=Vitis vinifera TaxID=29760 RepID=A0A438EWM8_VITVI|nr:hypothetical protein CK203_095085 [Vitis vinifera]
MFRVVLFSLAFRFVVHSMAFRATISFQFGVLEPPSHYSSGVQSHHLFSVTTFRVVLLSLAFRALFGIQSHHIFNLAFRVASPVWHSKPYLQFGVQSRIFSLVFRAIVCLQFDIQIHCSVWHSESSYLLHFGIRAIVQLDIQFHHLSIVLAFRAVVHTHSGGRFLEGHVSPQEWSSNNGILPVKRSGGFAKRRNQLVTHVWEYSETVLEEVLEEKERELRSLGGSKG